MNGNIMQKPLAVALMATFLLGATASTGMGQSREELERWAQNLVSIRNNQCKEENKKNVVGKIDYATMLISHSEVEEAESSLAMALSSAQADACRQAIEANAKLSGVK